MRTLGQYALETWLPNHVVEATTRQGYRYLLNRYIVPELGDRKMAEIMSGHVREWVARLQAVHGARPPTVRRCKVVLDALFTTALNDQVTLLHPGKGVKTPPVATRPCTIVTVEQFDRLLQEVDDDAMRLLLETDIETGVRWGELTELRPRDVDIDAGIVTVSRVVVRTDSAAGATRARFAVKPYPKDQQWRRVSISPDLTARLREHIERYGVDADDLIFTQPDAQLAAAGPRDCPIRRHLASPSPITPVGSTATGQPPRTTAGRADVCTARTRWPRIAPAVALQARTTPDRPEQSVAMGTSTTHGFAERSGPTRLPWLT